MSTSFTLVDDPDDPRLARFRLGERGLTNRLQRRDDSGDGLFMAEGDLVVERALEAGCVPVAALVDAQRPPDVARRLQETVEVYAGGETMRAVVTRMGMPYSVIALFERPPRATLAELAGATTRLVVCEAVDNPVNVGSIVRNALGLGWGGLVMDGTSCDPLARRSMRVSMGQALALPHARVDDAPTAIRSLVEAGWSVFALTPAPDALSLDDVSLDAARHGRVALVLGSERSGLTPEAMAAATARVAIPMHSGVDSLNVAAASAIACWHLRASD
jgi:tRNA G18 (ribose-2'-O)-methylase SpoU